MDKLLPDTSVIIEGLLSAKISNGEIVTGEVIIHEAVIAELEHQANMGKSIGYLGLDEIQRLKDLTEEKGFELNFKGVRPSAQDIRHASLGEIDALIRQLAHDEDATLLTSDKVQSEVALARGMKVRYYKKPDYGVKKLKLDKYFDEMTMSVHLRENVPPVAKKGAPGKWEFVHLRKALMKQEEIQDISREIIEDSKLRRDAFIEIEREGSTIVQLGSYRIVITRPPFSDGWEITAVRPVKKLSLDDYKLSEKLMKRVGEQAEGILIAGAPGMGKCLPGDEIVYSNDFKPYKAKDLFNSKNDILYSIDKNGKFTEDKIISKSKRKENKLLEIKTKTNRRVKVTQDHPILVFDKTEIKWKEAKQIKQQDKIAVIKKIRTNEDDSLNILDYYDSEKTLCYILDNKLIPIYFRFKGTKRKIVELLYNIKKITNEDASIFCNKSIKHIRALIKELKEEGYVKKSNHHYFLIKREYNIKDYGFLLLEDIQKLSINKDKIKKISYFTNNLSKLAFISFPKKITPELCRFLGYIYSEGGGEKISFTNSDSNLVDDFKKCALNVFGITNWKKCGLTHYIDWSSTLHPILIQWGFPIKKLKKSRIMKLPDFLMKCSLQNLRNFLQAYFDGDGGIEKDSRSIQYYTSSNEAAKQLTLQLMRLGIFSSFHKKFQKGAFRYTIRIFDLLSIKNDLEWASPIYQMKLKRIFQVGARGISQYARHTSDHGNSSYNTFDEIFGVFIFLQLY